MSEPNEKSATHDSFSTKPAVEKLTFQIIWKNSDRTLSLHDKSVLVQITYHTDTAEKRNWDSFKKSLGAVAYRQGYTIAKRVSYLDSDYDAIPIDSQCEFEEAVKYAKIARTKNQTVFLIVEKESSPKAAEGQRIIESFEKVDLISLEGRTESQEEKHLAMPPMRLDDGEKEARQGQWQSQLQPQLQFCNVPRSGRAESLGDTAPEWFANYMQIMKEEMITEISKRVTKTVIDALGKKRESQYDSATSHPRASDSDCLLDSDLDEDRSEGYSIKSRGERVSLAEQAASNLPETREKKTSDASSRSGAAHRLDNSRRRHRHADKQRKKHNKNHASQLPCNDEIWHSPSLNRRRAEKAAKKREIEEARALPQPSGNSGRSEQITPSKSVRDVEEKDVEELDNPYRRMMEPVNSADPMESSILKLRLVNTYNGNEQRAEAKLDEDVLRMGCSVTGQDVLERPIDRVPDYDALSDSDNISIISDVSYASDMQRINNSFEMILQRPMNLADEADDYGDIVFDPRIDIDRPPVATAEFVKADREIDDLDDTRDSSSFELLSESPSPALSIHMEEDHFSPGKNETSNYNMNDDATVDKRGNQSKIEICPYAIDAQGKIYQQNIIEGDEAGEEIVLEKRSGGAYSFVGETLPGSTKESVIITEGRPEASTDEVPNSAAEPLDDVTCDVAIEVTVETNIDSQGGSSADAFHESTQSFHSHTASQAENNRQDFTAFASTCEREEAPGAPRSHVFVDRNASKGLGDTKRSSPRKQSSAGDENPEDARSRRQRGRSTRQSSHDSHASGNRSSNPRQGERSRKFANWSTTRSTRMMDDLLFNAVDPMHILPETLVTGAVHVASSAYTTARRVYDKILTAQTRKPADKSKFGRR